MERAQRLPGFAAQGRLGLLLVAVCWPLNWTLPGQRTAYLFFPLWLGYILVVDALVYRRSGSSLWSRSRRGFALLFVLSAPAWWLFEIINNRTGNWEYRGAGGFTPLEYNALCTLCFSTVIPAVFETAELARTFRWVKSLRPCARIPDTQLVNVLLLSAGVAMLVLTLLWPRFFYPFVWISLAFILEPMNRWLRRPHLLQWLKDGDWRPVISLSLGALICGFFWEMWNEWSWPQWIYHTPGADVLHVFEMPLPGYGGYVPFALELFALKNFIWPGAPKLQL
ncbi:MAG TPA: hypothetical protein VME24_13090 [Alphaproteobacteria bacterium]|nr:hypothetical protein [Alphaproteobacteria bacterium]